LASWPKKLQNDGHSVLLAAGDTFRAAAVEQLQVWGERNRIPVIAQHSGADAASVIYDAIQAATARHGRGCHRRYRRSPAHPART
jgi:fused signal recognition particle receptor